MFALPTASVILTNLIVLVFAFTIHELAHAVTADRFGDPTPRREGRITLNPLAHLDIIGTLLFLLRGFGWARPVNVDPYYLRRASPAAMMWVSVAGPLSNLGLALLAAIPFRLGLVSPLQAEMDTFIASTRFLPTVAQVLYAFVQLNLLLLLFNLLPIAPLDGEKIAEYFFPPAGQRLLDAIRPYGPMILLFVILMGLLTYLISPPLSWLMRLLIG